MITSKIRHALVGLLLVAGAGCGDNGSHERYRPSDDAARQALETALTAWQNGRAPGRIGDGPPAVQWVDSRWKAGSKLSGFEILKEESIEGANKCFSVRLNLPGKAGQQVVRYVVVGKDPLFVYREEEFKGTTGM